MFTKEFVPCIYLYRKNCVKSFQDVTVISEDPVKLAQSYCDAGADELIVFDMSETDAEHDAALDIMKDICAKVEVDVIGAGNVKRMEDIKKILYTGCKKAVLNYTKQSNVEITEEVSLKFGKEKILLSFQDAEVLAVNKETIEKYVSGMILMNPHEIHKTMDASDLPFYVHVSQIGLDKMMDLFKYENVCGITGNAMNDNVKEITSLKEVCEQNGVPVRSLRAAYTWDEFKKDDNGLVPVVVQDYKTNEVLMLAYMNEEAYKTTLRTGKMCYYSRSRKEQWLKGDTSGHYQYVKSLAADCDMDTILAKVSQVGAACHTGKHSCFFNEIAKKEYEESHNPLKVFEDVFAVIQDRKVNPKEGSYTNYLFDKGVDKILKKLGEEATEIVIAAKNPNPNEIKYEISDFLYHCMVLMAEKGVSWEDITTELANR
ncbi:MAG: bifunctional phosphoribosyl-AMP cyclohydrolase/phosphoribosyl-ATP diphosphatase HisIE [Lachnospiraceae bacterium]|nr:bifunctional phosphoribosyl-AMP cyclohydrolase/phosphoribosyl-ATP diphosphatase HisIE [Lachnospiraceae bacterium]